MEGSNNSKSINIQILNTLEQIVFNLNDENLEFSVRQTMNFFDANFPYSFNLIICMLVHTAFSSQRGESGTYLSYLKSIQTKEEEINNDNPKIIDFFGHFLSESKTQESLYLLEKMINLNLINSSVTKEKETKYFAHYKTIEESKYYFWNDPFCNAFFENYEELSKNEWELHKRLVREGVNPSNIGKAIRSDDIEELQEISSQTNFDFNQKIEPSLYERFSFVNKENVSLIDYAAFFGSIKCFKFLLLNGSDLYNSGKFAVAGGNIEIITLCEQNHSSFEGSCETAIQFHRNDIFRYIYDNEIEKIDENNQSASHRETEKSPSEIKLKKLNDLGLISITNNNYEILSFLEGECMKTNDSLINHAAKIGNLFLVKYFLENNQIPKDILVFASESGNIELVKFIFEQEGIDINAKDI